MIRGRIQRKIFPQLWRLISTSPSWHELFLHFQPYDQILPRMLTSCPTRHAVSLCLLVACSPMTVIVTWSQTHSALKKKVKGGSPFLDLWVQLSPLLSTLMHCTGVGKLWYIWRMVISMVITLSNSTTLEIKAITWLRSVLYHLKSKKKEQRHSDLSNIPSRCTAWAWKGIVDLKLKHSYHILRLWYSHQILYYISEISRETLNHGSSSLYLTPLCLVNWNIFHFISTSIQNQLSNISNCADEIPYVI